MNNSAQTTTVYCIYTDDGYDGRSSKIIGYFAGELNQIMTHLKNNNIHPNRTFTARRADVVDCSQISSDLIAELDQFGNVTVMKKKNNNK